MGYGWGTDGVRVGHGWGTGGARVGQKLRYFCIGKTFFCCFFVVIRFYFIPLQRRCVVYIGAIDNIFYV